MGEAARPTGHEPEPGHHSRGQPSSRSTGARGPSQDLAQLLARTARELDAEPGPEATIHALVAAAVAVIPGAQSAGITEVHHRGRQVEVTHASDQLALDLNTAQSEAGEGPGLDAAYQPRTVLVEDFATEQRWPVFAPRAQQLGARSLLSLQLHAHGEDLAVLTLCSRRPQAFTSESEQIGLMFAAHAAIAMSTARREQQFRAALDSRDIIGQAKGILMERFKITADQAFHVLVRASSKTGIKLRDVAEAFATTGELPRPPPSAPHRQT